MLQPFPKRKVGPVRVNDLGARTDPGRLVSLLARGARVARATRKRDLKVRAAGRNLARAARLRKRRCAAS